MCLFESLCVFLFWVFHFNALSKSMLQKFLHYSGLSHERSRKFQLFPHVSNVQYVNHCCKCQDLRECHCRWLPHGKSYIMCSAKWTSNRLEVYYTNITFQTNKFCKLLLGQSNCNHVIQWMLSIHHEKCFLIPVG